MGVMTLLGRVVDTDPTAVAVGSLTGLALGVGFALMIVDRFREEPRAAPSRTRPGWPRREPSPRADAPSCAAAPRFAIVA